MTTTENRPGDDVTGPARKAQVSAGAINDDTAADCSASTSQLTFGELLQALGHGDAADLHRDKVAVCWERPTGCFTPELKDPEDAARFVDGLLEDITGAVDVWFGINPVSRNVTRGRGTVKDVTRLAALYADLDVKPGGCPDLDTRNCQYLWIGVFQATSVPVC